MPDDLDRFLVHMYMEKLKFMRKHGYSTTHAHPQTVKNTARDAGDKLKRKVSENQVIRALKRVPIDVA